MPTLSELRVRASYDQKAFKAGLESSKAEMREAGKTIKQHADAAEAAVKSSVTKIGGAYASLPVAARKAYDDAIMAQRDYQAKLSQGMNQVGLAMSVGITAPFALFARESLNVAASFEQTMDILQVSVQATTREMAALRAEAVKLGSDINLPATSANDAARAMNMLAKGGLTASDALKAARGTMQLAAATGTDAAEAATIQARALAAFELEGAKATRVADLLAKANYSATGSMQDMAYALQMSSAVMHQAGITIDETVGALTMMAKAGLVGSDAGTSLKTMFMRLMESGNIKQARDLMAAFGIEIYDTSGAMKDMRSIIAEFAPMMDNLTEKQRNSALATIFGADAVRAANILLRGGVKAYDEMTVTLSKEGAAAELAAARNKGLAGAIDGLKSAWETLAQQSADGLLRPLADLTRGVAGFIGELAAMDPTSRAVILGLGGIAAAAGPLLIITAQLKTAWIALFGIRTAATVATASAAASESALAVALTASDGAAAKSVASKAAVAVANEAVAVTAGQAAAATVAASAASTTAAGSTGVLAGAMTALTGPVGLVILGVAGLTAALVGLYKWSQIEAEQARERERQFKDEIKTAYESAKAKVELQAKSKDLLNEYSELAKKTNKSNDEQKKFQDLANSLSLLMPDLVQKYKSTGDAILDVAKAYKEAATQAEGYYDKALRAASARVHAFDAQAAAQRAAELRDQGAGRSLTELRAGMSLRDGSMFGWDQSVWGDSPSGPLFQAIKNTMLAERKLKMGIGSADDVEKARQQEIKAAQDLNDELRKTLAEGAELRRKQTEDQRAARLGPEGYAKYQAQQQDLERKAQWRSEAEKAKKEKQYQKERDAYLKSLGYGGIDDMTTAPKGRGATSDDQGLTAALLQSMAKKVRTPEGQASCGFFAIEILKQTGALVGSSKYHGGAFDLVQRVKAAGGIEVSANQARAGDLVYYHGPQYGAKKDARGWGHHVGVYQGDGYVVDSSNGRTRTRNPLNAGARFVRPMRTGRFDTGGEFALAAIEQAEQEAARLAELEVRRQQELRDAYAKTHAAIAGLLDPNTKYAELLGLQLERYKKLTPEEKARAERLYGLRSKAVADKELAQMRAAQDIEGILDPTDKAMAVYRQQLNDRKDLTDADKARLIDAKRAELVKQRADSLAAELKTLADEKAIIEAITEQEQIRLRLKMSRPELSASELDALANAEIAKFNAEQSRQFNGELSAKQGELLAAQAQLSYDQAMHKIAGDLALTEYQRYKMIEDQNDALRMQLYTIEQLARVQRGEITPEQAKQLVQAEQLQVQAQRASKDQLEQTKRLERLHEDLREKQREHIDGLAQEARAQAETLADIIMRPFEDGLGKGIKGFWKSLLDGWRQTIRQMFLDWARSQLMRSLEPLFEGRALRQAKADQAQGRGSSAIGAFASIISWLPKIRFAAGGNMPYGQPALVGEFGPEIWTPPSSGGRIHNAAATERMLSSQPVINITQVIHTKDSNSFRRSSRQMASEAGEQLGRSMRRNFTGH